MKKMMIALVAMFVMTMSANAQSNNNFSFDRMSRYLELTVAQVEPVRMAMVQFSTAMEAFYQLEDSSKSSEAWQKIEANHKAKMKKILNEKQYDKYVQMLDLTVKNTAEQMAKQNDHDVAKN